MGSRAMLPAPVKSSASEIASRAKSNSQPVACWAVKPTFITRLLATKIATSMLMANKMASIRVPRPRTSRIAPTVSSKATNHPKKVGNGTPICFKNPPKPAGPFIGELGLSLGQPWTRKMIPIARRRINRPQSLYGEKMVSNMNSSCLIEID